MPNPIRATGRLLQRLGRALGGGGQQSGGGGNPNPFIGAITSTWGGDQPAAWVDNPQEQIKHYKHWVYVAVTAIAERVAATPLKLFKRVKGGEAEEVTDHPVMELFDVVNPFHTRFWLWNQTATFLKLTGNAYWYMPSNGLGVPGEIWLAHSQFMKVIPDSKEFIKGYKYDRGGGAEPMIFEPHEIVHLKLPNPASVYYGRGPLQAAAETVDAHEAQKTVQFQMMSRGAFPGGAVTVPEGVRLSQDQIDRIRAGFRQTYAGADKAGRWVILEGGLKAEPLTLTPQEMAFMKSAQLNRDEILSVFKVPPAVVGLSKDVNRAVASAMDMIFARYTIQPMLQLVEDQLNQDLLPRYDEKLFVKFDSPVAEDKEAVSKQSGDLFVKGILTVNEVRAAVGWGEVDDGDTRYMPINMVPVGGDDYVEPEAAGGEAGSPAKPASMAQQTNDMFASRESGRITFEADAARAVRGEMQTQDWYVKAYLDAQAKLERKMTRAFERFFSAQGRRVLSALAGALRGKGLDIMHKDRADDIVARIFKERQEAEKMGYVAMPFIEGSLVNGAETTLESIGMQPTFNLDSPEAREFLGGKGTKYWQSTEAPNATTIKKIHTALAAGFEAGETPTELAARVRGVFTAASRSRSQLIARTETVGAYNGGGQAVRDGLAREKIRTKKGWIATIDDLTRDDHKTINGTWVDSDKPFHVGGESLMYPGDPAGSPAQVCNCRCACPTKVV